MSEPILKIHLKLCDEAYDLLLQENEFLKRGELPSAEMFDRKKDLLERLNHSVKSLKEMNEAGPIIGLKSAQLVREGQNKLMKIFLLDRENEKLVMEIYSPTRVQGEVRQTISRDSIQEAYKRYATQS